MVVMKLLLPLCLAVLLAAPLRAAEPTAADVLKALVGVLDWNLSMQDAINLPNMIALGDIYIAEPSKFPSGVVDGLTQRGITIHGGFAAEASGLHGVIMRNGRLEGGADPRREGIAAGY